MDDTGDVTEDCEQDVDEQVTATATLEENTKRGKEDGEDNFADIPNGQSCQYASSELPAAWPERWPSADDLQIDSRSCERHFGCFEI